MGAARVLDCTTANTANGRVIKGELLFAVMICIRRFGTRKLESKCMSCARVPYNKCNWYDVVVVKDGVPLYKAVSRILGELHVLISKGIILELNPTSFLFILPQLPYGIIYRPGCATVLIYLHLKNNLCIFRWSFPALELAFGFCQSRALFCCIVIKIFKSIKN